MSWDDADMAYYQLQSKCLCTLSSFMSQQRVCEMVLQATMRLLGSSMLSGSTACLEVCRTCLEVQAMVIAAPGDLVSPLVDQLGGRRRGLSSMMLWTRPGKQLTMGNQMTKDNTSVCPTKLLKKSTWPMGWSAAG